MSYHGIKNAGVREAVKIVGSVRALGEKLGISKQAIYGWPESLEVSWALRIEALTGGKVRREKLCPEAIAAARELLRRPTRRRRPAKRKTAA
jgi:DNA-binding transcriptional regulator YdaS (Cro superfamily)